MADVDEYLEKLFSEGLKRTLPFFATAIGITGTLLGYDGSQLPRPSWQPLAVLLYAFFFTAIGCLSVSFAWLFNAVRQRTYRYPPSETDLHRLATEFRDYQRELGLNDEALEAAVLREMRSVMVDEYAQSASFNRELNRAKLLSRSQAIFYLMVGLAICFVYGSLAFAEQKLATRPALNGGAADGQRGRAAQSTSGIAGSRTGPCNADAPAASKAAAADDPRTGTPRRLPAVARGAVDAGGPRFSADASVAGR